MPAELPLVRRRRESFDDFYRAEYPRLLRLLSAADLNAADALQEAFTKAATSWARVGRYDDPAAWVRRVAVHHLLNERRSRRRRDAAVERLGRIPAREPFDPDRRVDLDAAIAALPTRQRVALTLFYLGGLSSEETANAMGITAGAVRFHLHQARETLRTNLGDHDA